MVAKTTSYEGQIVLDCIEVKVTLIKFTTNAITILKSEC